ncbi:MAG: PH domain-containing protein [Clostridia bacterium]|nr:PH domain-containing protein [Clostridia bacterium]
MLFFYLKPLLFLLILPVSRKITEYFTGGSPKKGFRLEILILASTLLLSAARYSAFRIIYNQSFIIIKSGAIFKGCAKIPVSSLSSLQTEQSFIDALFGAVTCKINTEAGVRGKADFRFKLNITSSRELTKLLFGGSVLSVKRFSPLKAAVMAAVTSSAITGAVVGVPILNRAGKLLSVAVSQKLLERIQSLSNSPNTFAPPIVNTISLIFLAFYGFSFFYLFLRYLNFRLVLHRDEIEVCSGFFVRKKCYFKKSAVTAVKIEQAPLMRLFKRYSVGADIGGFGEAKHKNQIILPAGRATELKSVLKTCFPFIAAGGKSIRVKRSRLLRNRFLFLPSVYLLCMIIGSAVLARKFKDFTHFIFFSCLTALFLIFCYSFVCLYEYRHSAVCFGKIVHARSIKGFRAFSLYIPQKNLGEIKITRFGMDFPLKTCRVRLTVCSEQAESIRIKHLDYKTVMAQIKKDFLSDE